MSKVDNSVPFTDMITTQDLSRGISSDKQVNKNHTNSKEKNAPKNYGKNQKTTTVISDKKSCKRKKK